MRAGASIQRCQPPDELAPPGAHDLPRCVPPPRPACGRASCRRGRCAATSSEHEARAEARERVGRVERPARAAASRSPEERTKDRRLASGLPLHDTLPRLRIPLLLAAGLAALASPTALADAASASARPSGRCRPARRRGSTRSPASSSRSRCRTAPGARSGASQAGSTAGSCVEVSEADVGSSVVLVFKALGVGNATRRVRADRGASARRPTSRASSSS